MNLNKHLNSKEMLSEVDIKYEDDLLPLKDIPVIFTEFDQA